MKMNLMFKSVLSVLLVFLGVAVVNAQKLRWNLIKNKGIEWTVNKGAAHTDKIEMSGKQIAAIITYGVDNRERLVLKKRLIFPMLRVIPNDTFGSLMTDFDQEVPSIQINGKAIDQQPKAFSYNGIIKIKSERDGVSLNHEVFPSVDKPALIERITLRNIGKDKVRIVVPRYDRTDSTDRSKGVYGVYILNTRIYGAGSIDLLPGESHIYSIVSSARKSAENPYEYSASYEAIKRTDFANSLMSNLVFKSPNDTLNQMFAFAKIRAAESVFDTKNGLMHGPGGGAYYAAIWANDEAEYMNPLFPFLGNAQGNESAINSFRLFANYMNADYKPIPSSIIAEGTDTWHGAGDRGDQAMIAYGASKFALAYADTIQARKLWPLIEWSLEYLRRKKSPDGVIASDSDELEGRLPAGKINLSTNSLTYGALLSAADLAKALGKKEIAANYIKEASELSKNIEKYFGANVQGFDTYRYYEGNTTLRSWIGLPLVMGIMERKDQTLKALFSDHLWTEDGMRSETGSVIFWDRSLLYAMQGFFNGGATDTTLKYLKLYSAKRLLGEHVPYAVEAWPEGDQRHLSAESGLYCRAITEGLFGIQPKGFNRFTLRPRLPAEWNEMSLHRIRAFNNDFSIQVTRLKKKFKITVRQADGKSQEIMWDGDQALEVTL